MHDRSGNIIVPLRVVGEQMIVDDPHKSQERFTDHRISRINPRRKEERGTRMIFIRAYIRTSATSMTIRRSEPTFDISIDKKEDGIIFSIWRLITRLYPRSILERLHYLQANALFFSKGTKFPPVTIVYTPREDDRLLLHRT